MPWTNSQIKNLKDRERYQKTKQDPIRYAALLARQVRNCTKYRRKLGVPVRSFKDIPKKSKLLNRLDLIALKDPIIAKGRHFVPDNNLLELR